MKIVYGYTTDGFSDPIANSMTVRLNFTILFSVKDLK
jgi:hypothetical protein